MMVYYGFIIIATILFASQFLFNQQYQNENGNTLSSAIIFSGYSSVGVILMMLLIGKLEIKFSWFSLGVSTISAISNILYSYSSIKAFSKANLSVYSMFAMLGGMILPSIYGIMFYGESMTIAKFICCGLIAISLFITVIGEKNIKIGVFYYFAVFVLNGMSGVISKFHQEGTMHVDSTSFMLWGAVIRLILCIVIIMVIEKKIPIISKKSMGYSFGYAILSGLGNLFTLIALNKLDASIQYPIITGGTMLISTLISFIRKEKLTNKNVIAAIIAFVSSIAIVL